MLHTCILPNRHVNRKPRRLKQKHKNVPPKLPPGNRSGQIPWRQPSANKANLSLDYGELYKEYKSHAKVREVMRLHLRDLEDEVVVTKVTDLTAVAREKEVEHYDRFIRGTSGFNTSYSPFFKRPKLAPTKARMERAKKKREKVRQFQIRSLPCS